MCGDFLQLPPVNKENGDTIFCFESDAWKNSVATSVVLKKVFRQAEQTFVNVLNELRIGRCNQDILKLLQVSMTTTEAINEAPPADGIEYTRLFPHKRDVDTENLKRLQQLQGQSHFYDAIDTSRFPNSSHLAQLQKGCPAPAKLELKRGAQVILLKNLKVDRGLGMKL
jgi:ATP-dependent DNA helicase PIF1